MVDKKALDAKSADRVEDALGRLRSGSDDAFGDLVLSEKVYNDLDEENIVLESFNTDVIKSYLPYSDRIYVTVCPACVDDDRWPDYKDFVETGSIVPILGAGYAHFDDRVVDITYSHNHVGVHEYFALRSLFAGAGGHSKICSHCVEGRITSLKAQAAKRKIKQLSERNIRAMMANLHPYIEPDFELLDQLEEAIGDRDLDRAKSIYDMTWMLSQMRSASTFNSPVIVPGVSLQELPTGYSDEIDGARDHAVSIQKNVGDGIGIQIPEGLSTRKYIEVASDFRPRIQKLVSTIASDPDPNTWGQALDKEIMSLNQEAASLSKSARYIALAAVVEFYNNNHIKLNAALFAASMSLGAGALGCGLGAIAGTAGSAAVTSTVAGIAGSKGLISGGPSLQRAALKVSNSVQPFLDKLIAAYVGTSPMAVSILSLKKDIERSI